MKDRVELPTEAYSFVDKLGASNLQPLHQTAVNFLTYYASRPSLSQGRKSTMLYLKREDVVTAMNYRDLRKSVLWILIFVYFYSAKFQITKQKQN